MDDRSLREELLLIFKDTRNFIFSEYYYFIEKTSNNLFLRSVFSDQKIKLSFLEPANKKYQNENYTLNSVIILNCSSVHNTRKKEELLRTFFFLENLLKKDVIKIKTCTQILQGNLSELSEVIDNCTKKEIYSFFKIVEKEYLFKIGKTIDNEETKEKVKDLRDKINSYFNQEVILRYKGPFKWFIKRELLFKEEIQLFSHFKDNIIKNKEE